MKKLTSLLKAALSLAALCLSASAAAGPIIIAGTDADDHGFVSGGVNVQGWEFMQKAFQNIGGAVSNGNQSIVCLGCNGSTAQQAFTSSTTLSTLAPTWSFFSLTTVSDITNFFNGTGARNVSNTGIVYMPTVSNNVSGGITDTQLAIANANATGFASFVNSGGGLFTQEEATSSIGYGWLAALIPGFTVQGDNAGGVADSTTLQLTAAGTAAFPGLTSAEITAATPWHAYFTNFGSLAVLATGNGDNIGGFNDAVIIGGGATAVLGCGTPGQPPCTNPIPEPATISLLALGLLGFTAARRKSRK